MSISPQKTLTSLPYFAFPHAASTRPPLTTPSSMAAACAAAHHSFLARWMRPPLTTPSSPAACAAAHHFFLYPTPLSPGPSCTCKVRGARVPMTAALARPTARRCATSPRVGARSGGGRWPLARPCTTCAPWRRCGCAASVCCDNDDGDDDGATGSLFSSTTRGVVLMWHGMARWTDVPLGTARHG